MWYWAAWKAMGSITLSLVTTLGRKGKFVPVVSLALFWIVNHKGAENLKASLLKSIRGPKKEKEEKEKFGTLPTADIVRAIVLMSIKRKVDVMCECTIEGQQSFF